MIYRQFSIFLVLLFLSACSTGYAPVADISSYHSANKTRVKPRTNIKTAPNRYKVSKGDTLYSIAWKYGLDFKSLAKINNINSRYVIHIGQVLVIKSPKKADKDSYNKSNSINNSSKVSFKSNKNILSNKSIANKTLKKTQNKTRVISSSAKKKTTSKQLKSAASKLIWKAPAKGRVIRRFNNENKGLDFKGEQGDAVYAAASGKVVYAGNGIIGYGNLIIIKHSSEYLSAYAHNSAILITENKLIKAGEKIAEIGSTGTTKTMLHFEIRKDGKPVDPLKYLPKK